MGSKRSFSPIHSEDDETMKYQEYEEHNNNNSTKYQQHIMNMISRHNAVKVTGADDTSLELYNSPVLDPPLTNKCQFNFDRYSNTSSIHHQDMNNIDNTDNMVDKTEMSASVITAMVGGSLDSNSSTIKGDANEMNDIIHNILGGETDMESSFVNGKDNDDYNIAIDDTELVAFIQDVLYDFPTIQCLLPVNSMNNYKQDK